MIYLCAGSCIDAFICRNVEKHVSSIFCAIVKSLSFTSPIKSVDAEKTSWANSGLIAPLEMFATLGYGNHLETVTSYSVILRTKKYYDSNKQMTQEYLREVLAQYNEELVTNQYQTMNMLSDYKF